MCVSIIYHLDMMTETHMQHTIPVVTPTAYYYYIMCDTNHPTSYVTPTAYYYYIMCDANHLGYIICDVNDLVLSSTPIVCSV